MSKPLGRIQIVALQVLDNPAFRRERGVWHANCGWVITTTLATTRVMESLKKRGLLSTTPGPYTHPIYRLTPEGEAIILQLKAANWRT